MMFFTCLLRIALGTAMNNLSDSSVLIGRTLIIFDFFTLFWHATLNNAFCPRIEKFEIHTRRSLVCTSKLVSGWI